MAPDDRPATAPEKRDASRVRVNAIYDAIRERICLLRYTPGMTLSESELAAEFGVSRTPIRRALHRLEFDGLVESRRGVGTIVTTVDLRLLKEVLALRMKLAELIGELSPLPRSDEHIATIEALLERCEALHGRRDPEEFARINMQFQAELARAIGNRPLREIATRLYFQTARIWLQLVPELDWEEEITFFCNEISDVLEVMRAGDMTAVGLVRRNHISMSLIRMSRYLSGESGGAPTSAPPDSG